MTQEAYTRRLTNGLTNSAIKNTSANNMSMSLVSCVYVSCVMCVCLVCHVCIFFSYQKHECQQQPQQGHLGRCRRHALGAPDPRATCAHAQAHVACITSYASRHDSSIEDMTHVWCAGTRCLHHFLRHYLLLRWPWAR